MVGSKRRVEEEKGELEKCFARLEARFEASVQQLKDREEVRRKSKIKRRGAKNERRDKRR